MSGTFGDAVVLSDIETVVGGFGGDSLTISTNNIQSISGGAGFDEVVLTDASGNSLVLDGVEAVLGSTGNDNLVMIDGTSVMIDGGFGADTITGGFGDDFLLGGDGNDVLIGMEGHNTIIGGNGTDTAKFIQNLNELEFSINLDGSIVVSDITNNTTSSFLKDVEFIEFADGLHPVNEFVSTIQVNPNTNGPALVSGDGDDNSAFYRGADR